MTSDLHAATCQRCDRPMPHDQAVICHACAKLLARHLEQVLAIAGDITLTVAKLARVSKGGGSLDELGWWKEGDALEAIAMPVDLDAAARHDAAVGELTTWARLVAEQRGQEIPRGWSVNSWGVTKPAHPLRAAAHYLAASLEWLRHSPYADEAWPALLAACGELQRIVDASPAGELVGLCKCGTALYARPSETALRCPRCREEQDVDMSRSEMETALHGAHVTASEAAQWVARMGLCRDTGKLRKLIWAWADRGHLAPVDEGPRYRFGDVLRRVLDSPALLRAA